MDAINEAYRAPNNVIRGIVRGKGTRDYNPIERRYMISWVRWPGRFNGKCKRSPAQGDDGVSQERNKKAYDGVNGGRFDEMQRLDGLIEVGRRDRNRREKVDI